MSNKLSCLDELIRLKTLVNDVGNVNYFNDFIVVLAIFMYLLPLLVDPLNIEGA